MIIADNNGNPVYYMPAGPKSVDDFKLQPTGVITYFSNTSDLFYVMNSSLQIIDSITCSRPFHVDDHELRITPDGHIFLLADDYIAVDMSQVVPGGNAAAVVTDPVIEDLDAERHVVFVWRCIDHFNITDAINQDLTAPTIDFAHSNAIEIDNDGNLLLSSRHLSEITKININTGAIIWRLGGKNNQFRFTNDTIGFSYQHAIRRLANGDITLFDDGNYHTPPFSRAVEYSLDEQHLTATLVWQYRNTPDIFGAATGYVQRLSDGNTLIGWGLTNPTLSEVRPDGSVALEMTFPDSVWSYRVYRFPFLVINPPADSDSVSTNSPATIRWNESGVESVNIDYSSDHGSTWNNIISGYPAGADSLEWTVPNVPASSLKYRITESGQDDSGYVFVGDDIPVSGGVTRVGPSSNPYVFSLSNNYPNPFNPTTSVDFSLKVKSDVRFDVYNILGQKVLDLPLGELGEGNHSARLSLENLSSGVYFYKFQASGITGEQYSETKKLVLLK